MDDDEDESGTSSDEEEFGSYQFNRTLDLENIMSMESNATKLQKIFADYQLTIPEFQRPYCWTVFQAGQLLTDITNSYNLKKDFYFLGSVVLQKILGSKGVSITAGKVLKNKKK